MWLRAILASTVTSNLWHFSIQGRDMVRERSLEGALDQLNARIGLKIDCRVALKKWKVLSAPAPGHFRARLAN